MLIKETELFFDASYANHDQWKEKFLAATRYKEGFSAVEKFLMFGDSSNPDVPEKLQVFDNKIVHLYAFVLRSTLDWHKDSMILDALSPGKFTCLAKGNGILQVKDDNETVETYQFTENEKFRWVQFNQKKLHRFITNTETIMIMAATLEDRYIQEYFPGKSIYHGDSGINVDYPELLVEKEIDVMHSILSERKKDTKTYEHIYY